MRIWCEGWFEARFKGGLRLSLKGIQTNLQNGCCRSDDLKGFEAKFDGWFDQFEGIIN